jgi:hypothetical protein
MSWGTCYSGSNNIHFDFPPIMADGRNYASWQPEAVVNERIQKQENITTSWKYRQYLINNATNIMKINNQEACSALGLPSHFSTNATPSTNVPFTFKTTYDTNKPGYGYNDSNLKQPYLTREQLQARMVAPIINTNQ